ncbi:hypothetical protein, partial [Ralstonia pseudosolanacearum]|uniref:hypothetical protein n=1 Tax=Ralstonia pseudosolanacearum TaxID=1310165 RepID=UPI003CF6BCE2
NITLIASLCVLSLAGVAYCHEKLQIDGTVYCDTCRTLFETRASVGVGGAKVKFECRDRANANNITFVEHAVCDENGAYKFEAEGKHEDEICEVVLVESPRSDCNEVVPGLDRARVLVSDDNGITQTDRFVNPMGFLKKQADAGCAEVLKSYGLLPSAHI